ncbi:MAG: Gfo/Idh/MocA family oxidoreductase [Thaumarchaeota archaeon]|nr:Gfo/Idh/MocA family oxidoreductase [Nitrososphaerota archaeon]
MKFLIVGLGSMGKRRIRNLKQLEQNDIIGFDTREDRCNEAHEKYQIHTFTDIAEAIKDNPDAMVISTPPDLHMRYAKIAIENNIHFFTEASVIQDEMEEVIQLLVKSNIIGLPSCTMRYHPIVIQVNRILKTNNIGKPLAILYHSGQYLPDWHPWEDYRKFYVSKRKTGACREIVPFELTWLVSTFGKINSVTANKSKVSKLEADIDDIYNVLLEFKNGVQGNLTVDVIARFPYRQLKILGENGVIFADWSEKIVRYFTKETGWVDKKIDDGIIEKNYIHGEGMYIHEMETFLKSIKKEIPQPYTFEEDLKILKILEYMEKSSDDGTRQIINN